MDEVAKLANRGVLEKLAAGSWIHGNFDTWSGHSEKNRAWELIYQTKRDFAHHVNNVNDAALQEINFHFLAAQCSDWFWWYGDDHVTEFGLEFDALFREHLISVYKLLNIHPPAELFMPIVKHKAEASFFLKPQSAISPLIDGKVSSFFEWLGSGSIDESKLYSTMDRVRGPIEKIFYGQDEQSIYVAFDGDVQELKKAHLHLEVSVEESGKTFRFSMKETHGKDGSKLVIDERIELELPKDACAGFTEVHLRFEILKGKEIIQTMPGYGALAINLEENYAANWFI